MTTAALTPQERQNLNAWIAEHVYDWQWHEASQYLPRRILPHELDPISGPKRLPDYAGDWMYAGPLFDRYPGLVLMNNGNYYACTFGTQSIRGTTGPEAIAKAVKAWEESKR